VIAQAARHNRKSRGVTTEAIHFKPIPPRARRTRGIGRKNQVRLPRLQSPTRGRER
jgi:hypothetical protein